MQDTTIGGNSIHAKLRLTIPRQPDLETSHRAQRMRSVLHISVAVLTSNRICTIEHDFSNISIDDLSIY